MIPKEYQNSNLALELKAGKKRLEDALHVLSDEQCERARGTRSGSVMDVLLELVATKFLALMEVSDRVPGLPMNHLANADGRMPIASGRERPTENKFVENLVAEFLECCVRWSLALSKAAHHRVQRLKRSTGMSPMAITTTRNSLSVRVSP
jgi:hypothetical protein